MYICCIHNWCWSIGTSRELIEEDNKNIECQGKSCSVEGAKRAADNNTASWTSRSLSWTSRSRSWSSSTVSWSRRAVSGKTWSEWLTQNELHLPRNVRNPAKIFTRVEIVNSSCQGRILWLWNCLLILRVCAESYAAPNQCDLKELPKCCSWSRIWLQHCCCLFNRVQSKVCHCLIQSHLPDSNQIYSSVTQPDRSNSSGVALANAV